MSPTNFQNWENMAHASTWHSLQTHTLTYFFNIRDLQPVDIKSRWRHNWKSAQVVNSHLVCDPTIRQPGFDPRLQQVSAEPFSHGTGTLRCLQKEMATIRH